LKQRKTTSLIEAAVNTIVGFFIAIVGQLYLYWWLSIAVTWTENIIITSVFMGLSTLRSYLLRRLFEWLRVSGALR
jgi:hypothetical protein